MRGQWGLILGIVAALFIAIFAVINVEAVRVNYLFGTADWPLILVIIGSVLMGGIIVGAVGMVKVFQLQQEIKRLRQENHLKSNKSSNHLKGEQLNSKKEQNQTTASSIKEK